MIPDLILKNVAWSFAKPIPASPTDLVNAVAIYNAEIINEPLDRKLLTSSSSLYRLDVTYTYYAVQSLSDVISSEDEWDEIPMTVRIDGAGKLLSYADILWQLHTAAYRYLNDQDHHYFEGLALLPQQIEPGVPAYELWLGS